jgi:hypothetical protein
LLGRDPPWASCAAIPAAEQDRFVKEHITAEDVLVVSVGGNDIALAPSIGTILSMGRQAHVASRHSCS